MEEPLLKTLTCSGASRIFNPKKSFLLATPLCWAQTHTYARNNIHETLIPSNPTTCGQAQQMSTIQHASIASQHLILTNPSSISPLFNLPFRLRLRQHSRTHTDLSEKTPYRCCPRTSDIRMLKTNIKNAPRFSKYLIGFSATLRYSIFDIYLCATASNHIRLATQRTLSSERLLCKLISTSRALERMRWDGLT